MRYVELKVPEGVTVKVDGTTVEVTGPKGSVKKEFKGRGLKISVENGKVEVDALDKALINTMKAHIRNLIKGVQEGFTKKMVIRYSHFPIKVSVKGNDLVIENFLGERVPRKAYILDGVKVSVKGQNLTVEGVDLEAVSQTAANIREATKIRNKDVRIFQDGIYPVLTEE